MFTRLSRSLLDFARIMETFDRYQVAFVSVTQAFNTGSSMGRWSSTSCCRSRSSNGK